MQPATVPLTNVVHSGVVDRVCNFFVVITHVILYLHAVYPPRLFSLRNQDGACVYMCRHPAVSQYITQTITSLRPWLQQRDVQTIIIVIFRVRTRHIVARYVYDISLPEASHEAVSSEPSRVAPSQLAALDAQMRAHITRLMASAGYDMGTLAQAHSASDPAAQVNRASTTKSLHSSSWRQEEECSFDLVVDTRGVSVANDWIPADGQERWDVANAIATPIKDAEDFNAAASISCRMEVPAEAQQ